MTVRGIDVSENNGAIDFSAVKSNGIDFAIIRLGYGNCHLDANFYRNFNEAIEAGLKVGVYYYDYGLDVEDAKKQARFMLSVLMDCGITPQELEMGIYYDMEDADGWKARNGMPCRGELTAMCRTFIAECNKEGYECGLYACLDWLENRLAVDQLQEGTKIWCAQYNDECEYPGATMWQYTDSYYIPGCGVFDGNEVLE